MPASWPAGLASTLNQKSFAASLRSDRQKILSVSPRLLKTFKRCGLIEKLTEAIFTPSPRHGGSDSYRVSTFTRTAIAPISDYPV
jgi:hypothetical protein